MNFWQTRCWGASPKDGLALMWHIPSKLYSAQSRQAVPKNGNIHDCVKPRKVFSQLSFVYLLFSFNIFLITYFRVVLSFEPPLGHSTMWNLQKSLWCVWRKMTCKYTDTSVKKRIMDVAVSKEVHADRFHGHDRTHYYWFAFKMCNCRLYFKLPTP